MRLDRFLPSLLSLFAYAVYALGQSVKWCDPQNGLCFQTLQKHLSTIGETGSIETYDLWIGVAFPTDTDSKEFIGEIIASKNALWVGYGLARAMTNNLLLLVWPNENQFVYSARMAPSYTNPTIYNGPIITQLPSSTMNSTHWKFVFRCQNCTTWTGSAPSYTPGSITEPTATQGYGICLSTTTSTSSHCVASPSNSGSVIYQHTDFSAWSMNITAARTNLYSSYLSGSVTGTQGPSPTVTSITVTPSVTTTATSTSATSTHTASEWDYIVVGAGPAGLVVADRLSEAGKSVLLLERGGPATKETGGTREVPGWAKDTGLTRFDIPALFEAMFSAQNPWWWCDDITVLAGCVVGGGSSINGLFYWVPPDSDFSSTNGWPPEWTDPSAAVNRLLERLPSYESPSPDGRFYLDQVYQLLRTHYIKKGYTEVDVNAKRNEKDNVFGRMAYNFNTGIRGGATHTYLQTAKARSNFKLMTWTYARSLIRGGTNGTRITGVKTNNTLDLPDGVATLKPNGRVVLSGGCFGTARILFTSGIGPSDMLQLVASSSSASLLPPSSQYINLPVGHYASDNPGLTFVFAHPSVDYYENFLGIWSNPRQQDAAQYLANRTGVLAATTPRLSVWKSYNGSDGVVRYLQTTIRPGGFSFGSSSYNASTTFSMTFYLTQGITSRGRIGINSDLRGLPIVQPWFRDKIDRSVMATAIADEIANMTTNLPGLVQVSPSASQSIESYVNNYGAGGLGSNHWVGTTRIGANSSTSVVDTNCKVWGTENLFVVDAGIIPSQPMSNTHAIVYAVAELAAPRILALAGGP